MMCFLYFGCVSIELSYAMSKFGVMPDDALWYFFI